MAATSERVTFPGSAGSNLAARLDRPAGTVRAVALFAHCFICSKDILAASRIAHGLAERGIAVLRFGFTGIGASEGEFANTDFSSNVDDLVAAADFLCAHLQAPRILIGQLKRALLIFHAPRDATVGIDNAALIFQAAKHPKIFVSLDDADHLLSRPEDAAYVAAVLAAWAERYVSGRTTASHVPPAEPAEVTVEETRASKFAQSIRIGAHVLTADEPVAAGGTDSGPGPYDFLLAGLGACTSMTLRMYADHKGWPLEKVTVNLFHRKIHARDCETCETQEGEIGRIDRRVTLHGPLAADQRARLLEIADKYPVHRTLHSEVSIATSLA
ncbi:MAG: osmotically inducible protein C [Alphaproteobacteria bacterium]|nr:osmotically inducible protein C [Alphaproteobacteria bacterium]